MNLYYILGLTFTGIITGSAAGLIGAGTEILIVPLLTIFGLLGSLKMRIGTSLVMLLPPIGLFAAMKYYKSGYVDLKAGLYMAFLFTIAAAISATYSVQIDTDIVKKVFGIFTILAGFYIYSSK